MDASAARVWINELGRGRGNIVFAPATPSQIKGAALEAEPTALWAAYEPIIRKGFAAVDGPGCSPFELRFDISFLRLAGETMLDYFDSVNEATD